MIDKRLANAFNFFMFTASGVLSALGIASLLEILDSPRNGVLAAVAGGAFGALWGINMIIKRNKRHPHR